MSNPEHCGFLIDRTVASQYVGSLRKPVDVTVTLYQPPWQGLFIDWFISLKRTNYISGQIDCLLVKQCTVLSGGIGLNSVLLIQTSWKLFTVSALREQMKWFQLLQGLLVKLCKHALQSRCVQGMKHCFLSPGPGPGLVFFMQPSVVF